MSYIIQPHRFTALGSTVLSTQTARSLVYIGHHEDDSMMSGCQLGCLTETCLYDLLCGLSFFRGEQLNCMTHISMGSSKSEQFRSHPGLLGPKVICYPVLFPTNCGQKPSLACLEVVGLSGFHFSGNGSLKIMELC